MGRGGGRKSELVSSAEFPGISSSDALFLASLLRSQNPTSYPFALSIHARHPPYLALFICARFAAPTGNAAASFDVLTGTTALFAVRTHWQFGSTQTCFRVRIILVADASARQPRAAARVVWPIPAHGRASHGQFPARDLVCGLAARRSPALVASFALRVFGGRSVAFADEALPAPAVRDRARFTRAPTISSPDPVRSIAAVTFIDGSRGHQRGMSEYGGEHHERRGPRCGYADDGAPHISASARWTWRGGVGCVYPAEQGNVKAGC